jgi:glycosyltransferase involved in cell wall biosynthesis
MRIVYTTHQFFPDYGAGTETLTYYTAKEEQQRGHEVFVFTGYPINGVNSRCETFDQYEYDGIPVWRFYHSNTWSINPNNPMQAEYCNAIPAQFFEEKIRRLKPDLVHCYHLQRISASIVEACRAAGIPAIFTATDFWLLCPTNQLLLPDNSLCHGPDSCSVNCLKHLATLWKGKKAEFLMKYLPPRFLRYLLRGFQKGNICGEKMPYFSLALALAGRPDYLKTQIKYFGRIAVATEFMAAILIDFGAKSEQIVRLPFGIDTKNIQAGGPKSSDKELTLGFIGTLYYHKGAHVLLEAFRKLPEDLPAQIRLYGDMGQFPEYVSYLRSIAGNDQRIKFCGTFPGEEVGSVLHELDILVLPSLWYENSPLVLHMAQAANVPVIATNLGGMNELIEDGMNGMLFEPGDADSLGVIIRSICDNREQTKFLADNAVKPKRIKNYVDELEDIYAQVLVESGGAV